MSDQAILVQLGVLIISKNDLLKIHDDDPQINRMDVVQISTSTTFFCMPTPYEV